MYKKILSLVTFFALLQPSFLGAESSIKGRYFISGDGKISLTNPKTKKTVHVTYDDGDGFSPKSWEQINQLFGIQTTHKEEKISKRLIALLDALQDKFHQGMITIVSGYRSPEYNEGLRKKGRLAAMTSLHIEGMAADINIDGVDGKELWEYVRGLECCGAGYYHGKGIHIDTGPVRFWDETSTKVKEKLGEHNKLILADTEYDIYGPQETINVSLGRITDYPISIHKKVRIKNDTKTIAELNLNHDSDNCIPIQNRHAAKNLSLTLPEKIKSFDKARLEISFCEKPFPEMKDVIVSNPISLRK